MDSVEGKVAFVTGGDSGIGLGIARTLLNAGMKVAVTYQTQAHLDHAMSVLAEAGDRVHAVNVDVTDRRAMAAAAQETVRVFGMVHVLVNNAGIMLGTPLASATFDDFDWCMSANVTSVFNGVRTFLPYLMEHGESGHIVSTSSMSGVVVGPYWGVYSTSKFAVTGMMEALRSELAHTNIGVSVFCPSAANSNVGSSARNRPAALSEIGVPLPAQQAEMTAHQQAVQDVFATTTAEELLLDPTEAGKCVLRGILRNQLYIFSHPEFESSILARHRALVASIHSDIAVSEARNAFAELLCSSVYDDEVRRIEADGA